jgi:Tol biopolymer transport system component
MSHAARAGWSPTGEQIAFLLFGMPRRDQTGTVAGADVPDRGATPINIAIMDATTKRIVRLIPIGTTVPLGVGGGPLGLPERQENDYRSLWSPDGRRLLVRDVQRNALLVNVDGAAAPVSLGDVMASWSPDGHQLAITDRTEHRLIVMDVD